MNLFLRIYRTVAILFLTTCLLFIMVNLVLLVFFQIRDYQPERTSPWHDIERQKIVQPDLNEQEIMTLVEETLYLAANLVYTPYIQFKEPHFQGDFINIDENGFRYVKNQGVWPPDPANFNIFLLGGSTTFGLGVADEQTIASHLQEYLSNQLDNKVYVYNFGRSGHFSTQERIYFEQLLLSNVRPDLVIFLDGYNDIDNTTNQPVFTPQLTKLQEESRVPVVTILDRLPMMRLARALNRRLQNSQEEQPIAQPEPLNTLEVGDRYLANKRLIEAAAEAYGIQPVFVWQPIFSYNYDLQYHLFMQPSIDPSLLERLVDGYRHIAKLHHENRLGSNFLWLADMQAELQEPLYVDVIHYSDKMSKMVAIEIGDWLLEQELVNK